ncbi:hypothetical protein L211DRAFT_870469 [Terfezia boudieri ATCC MYA-4762]|uniref:Uncharacterized protein n=1 Tax=Terfezia boudieri ATCC MYA-4762 TaxID=1051890 RepID=A0A3N4LJA5_9PEZI|nr:hypothetical protein L211DRAFT_870469 [Terfezia boudieri ATCC MYA-4762]
MASLLPYNHLTRTSSSHCQQTHSIHPSKLREAQEKKMAYTQTFQLAQRARGKLQREAAQHDHNLRLLVGHANLLDNLMIALADAEREQEQWFNEVVRGSVAAEDEEEEEQEQEQEESRDWPEQCYESHGWLAVDYSDSESEEEDSGSEADSDEEMEDVQYAMPHLLRKPLHQSLSSYVQATIGVSEVDEYDEDFEDEDGMYPLTRASSHGSPPQLVADYTDDEEDESTPPSPRQLSLPFTPVKGKERIETTSFFGEDPHSSHHQTFLDGIHPPSDLISAF